MTSRPPTLLAVLGPTATGKSSLAIALARHYGGEVVNCDSTAVYRGFDIGTDKVRGDDRQGVPHHLIDLVEPTDDYTAAHYARDAARVIRDIHARGRLPIVCGGTGFYYRALTRGLFPGPGKDDATRGRLDRIAERGGPERLHRWLRRVDPPSAERIMPRDRKRLVRALEVYLLTGKPLTAHFADTARPLPEFDVVAVALQMPAAPLAERLARRVEAQFAAGLLDEVRGLLARGVPPQARPFGGLVYRQVMEHLRGLRGDGETRALIVRENRHYARRQLIWFRKEPTLRWFSGPGEDLQVQASVTRELAERGLVHDGRRAADG